MDQPDWRNTVPPNTFRFKQFDISQANTAMKVNTDGVLLGAWCDVTGVKESLDIGTGTGIIAIMLAQRNSGLISWGIDIDLVACEEARGNMQDSPYSDRLRCQHQSVQSFATEFQGKFDLIISNPPFFSGGTFSSNENKANVRHTIKLSHGDLLLAVRRLLHPKGHFDVILPYLEGVRFIEMAETYGFHPIRRTEVLSKKHKPVERLLISLSATFRGECSKDQIILHSDGGPYGYSEDFTALTRDFYLFLD